jgi:hypothetical protein
MWNKRTGLPFDRLQRDMVRALWIALLSGLTALAVTTLVAG